MQIISQKEGLLAVYGYARVSTRDQDLIAQDAELMAAGCAKAPANRASSDHRPFPPVIVRRPVNSRRKLESLTSMARGYSQHTV
jgi:hypothetical protein